MFKRLLACVVMIAALTSAVHAQRFPDRLIRIIMPFTPGGSNDIVALELAAGFQERFKQYAVVENRPGGGAHRLYRDRQVAARRLQPADRTGVSD